MREPENDQTIDLLMDMVGVYASPDGWWVKTEAKLVTPSPEKPFGIKYSLTLHRQSGERILGYDNSHGIPSHRKVAWDHKHLHERIKPYTYESAAKLLADFYSDVDRWLENVE